MTGRGLSIVCPQGLTLQPGDTLDAPTIIFPGLPLDDPTTPEGERLPKVIPGPWTVPYPDLAPTPSPSPESFSVTGSGAYSTATDQ